MANKKISELDALTSVVSSDYIAIVDASTGVTKRAVLSDLPDTNTTYSVGDGGLTTNDFTNADHSKLNAIEASATADQSNAEIVAAVEAGTDSNTFTDADHTKLNAIEASADVTDATNVTAAGALMDSELAGIAAVKATTGTFLTADQTKLDGIAASATVDQSASAIKTLLEDGIDSVHYVDDSIDADHLANSINTDIATGVTANTTANAALPKAGGTMTGTTTLLGITETEAGTANATYTIDLANGTLFEVTHASLCTVTMPTAAAGKAFTVIATVPAAWSGTILWSGGAAPTGGSGKTIYSFVSNGTSWYGMRAGTGFA